MEDTSQFRDQKGNRIHIGESYKRWTCLRDGLGLSLDSDLALLLLDSYEKFTKASIQLLKPVTSRPYVFGSRSDQCPSCGFLLSQRCLQNRDITPFQSFEVPKVLEPKEEPVSVGQCDVSKEEEDSEGSGPEEEKGDNSGKDWISHQHQTLTRHKKTTQTAVTVKEEEESEGSGAEDRKGGRENSDEGRIQAQHQTLTRINKQTETTVTVKEEEEEEENQNQTPLRHRTRTLIRTSKQTQQPAVVKEESGERERIPGKRKLCSECGAFYQKLPHVCEHKTKPFVCNVCGKRCVSESALKIHSGIHSETYEYTCKYCYINFKSKADKLEHEISHQDQKNPFQCRDCELSFASYKDRMKHIRQHRDDTPFKCVVCGIVFRQRSRFLRHVVVHTGERAFKCPMCERGFNQKGHLESHMRLHTGERPYSCKHCGKSYNHNVSLKSHVQRYHPMEQEAEETGEEWFENRGEEGDTWSQTNRHEEEEETSVKAKKGQKPHTGRPKGRPKRKYPKMTDDSEEDGE